MPLALAITSKPSAFSSAMNVLAGLAVTPSRSRTVYPYSVLPSR